MPWIVVHVRAGWMVATSLEPVADVPALVRFAVADAAQPVLPAAASPLGPLPAVSTTRGPDAHFRRPEEPAEE